MNVEIWSDVVCPWCYIGKRRFEAALARFEHRDDVRVTWRSFELDPEAPNSLPGTLAEVLAAKKGIPVSQAAAMSAQVTALAAADGLDYRLDQARSGNTFDAHRLIHLAAAHGRQDAMKEALLRAYFTEGRAIGDHETLVAVAAAVGLPEDEARAVLAGGDYADAVRDDEQRAAGFGISGVPFFVIDERYGVSGAQPVAVFSEVLEKAWQAGRPLVMAGGADAAACDGDSCAV